MDFSLGKNSLDSYINFDKNVPSESDSFRSIKEYNKLEAYLSLKKEENENMLNELWTKVQRCEVACMQVSDSVDTSRSRINQDNTNINIERYEDLLPFSFKQIQWAKSSRVMLNDSNKPASTIIQYEKRLQTLQGNYEASIVQNNKMQDSQLKICNQQISKFQEASIVRKNKLLQLFSDLQGKLEELNVWVEEQFNQLDSSIESLPTVLVNLLDKKIEEIQVQITSCSQ